MNWLVQSMQSSSNSTSGIKGYLKRIMKVQEFNGTFFITEKDTGILVSYASSEDEAWEKAEEYTRSTRKKEEP